MDRYDIRKVFEALSMSQGFYGRVLEWIDSMSEETREGYWKHLEDLNFQDSVDLILYIEGGV